MATNKSKEAAALFELIDKSTLKVPKNAGALKIPSWWSSKTNPAAGGAPAGPGGATGAAAAGSGGGAGGQAAAGGAAKTMSPSGGVARANNGAPAGTNGHGLNGNSPKPGLNTANGHGARAEAAGPSSPAVSAPAASPTQQRLFQPPPAGETPVVTPSIRPPARTPVAPTIAAPAGPASAPAEAAAAEDVRPTEAIPEEELQRVPEALENKPAGGGFSAAGMGGKGKPIGSGSSSGTRAWQPASRGFLSHFSQVPMAALIGAGAAVLLVVLGIIYLATRHHGATAPAQQSVEVPLVGPGAAGGTPENDGGGTMGGGQQQLIPSNSGSGMGSGVAGNPGSNPPPSGVTGGGQEPATVGSAKIYEPNTYHFLPDKLYVFVASDHSEANARRNAKFLAEHGISVAIERSGAWYVLIATEPLASNVAAEPFLKKIRDIGKLHPDYRSNNRVFADAVPRRVVIGASGK